jgi:branched-chain amino acid transport system substrate-binding protein
MGALTACGSSSSGAPQSQGNSPAAGTSSAPGGTAASGTPYPVGYICDCTGPDASSVNAFTAVIDAWAKSTNAAGGIDGHPIDLITKDDGQNSATSLTQVTQMVDNDHVIGIIDNSDVDAAWSKFVDSKGVPVVGGNQASDLYLSDPNWFAQGATANTVPLGIIGAAQKAHVSALSVLYCTNVPVCAQTPPVLKKLGKPAGVGLAYSAGIPNAAPNYTAPCLASKQAGANGVFVAGASSQTLGVVTSCQGQGYKPKYLAAETSITYSALKLSGLNGAVGEITNLSATDTSNAQIRAMQAALNKYEPGYLTSPNFAAGISMAWASGVLFAQAAEAGHLGNAPTAAKLKAGLYALKGTTLDGLSSPITYTKGKPTPLNCWFYYGIQNGKFISPYGTTPDCAPAAG